MSFSAPVTLLQLEIQKWIADNFSTIGDHNKVKKDVRGYSLDNWIGHQKTLVTTSGMGFSAVGRNLGLAGGVATAVADTAVLLRQTAHAAWGIGELKGANVDPHADLLEIWRLWINNKILKNRIYSVSGKYVALLNSVFGGMGAVNDTISMATAVAINENFLTRENALHFGLALLNSTMWINMVRERQDKLSSLSDKLATSKQYPAPVINSIIANKTLLKTAANVAIIRGTDYLLSTAAGIGANIAAKTAANQGMSNRKDDAAWWKKLLRFTTKTGINAAVGGGINWWVMDNITRVAIEYYDTHVPLIDD